MKPTSGFDLALSVLQEQVASARLLPPAYARYRKLLADGLVFFLHRLSPTRLQAIFKAQMHLPRSISTPERVVALLRHVPALHKLGQVLARDRRLTKGFRHRLQQLESMTPQSSGAAAANLLKRSGKEWHKQVILDPAPLAEGSVAIVLPFNWYEEGAVRKGVFKLLKPGVKRRLEEDLEVLGHLAVFLDERCGEYHLPQLDYRGTFETIRDLLLHEVRFENEQQHLAEAAKLYPLNGRISVPALFPFCSPEVTAMERLEGEHLEFLGGSPGVYGSLIMEGLIARPFFSTQPAPLFHADPHAGNLLALPNSRLGVIDWSLTGRLRRETREAIVELLFGAIAFDVARMHLALDSLTERIADPVATSQVLSCGLRDLRWGCLPGLAWVTHLLDELVTKAQARFSADLVLFRKSLLTLEGLLADLTGASSAAVASMDAAMFGGFLRHWVQDFSQRLLRPFEEKSPTTHLSNLDLVRGTFTAGPAALRWIRQTIAG